MRWQYVSRAWLGQRCDLSCCVRLRFAGMARPPICAADVADALGVAEGAGGLDAVPCKQITAHQRTHTHTHSFANGFNARRIAIEPW